jgi:cell division transport system permease protein
MAVSESTSETPIKTPRLRLLPWRPSRRRSDVGQSPIVPPSSIASTALMTVVAIMSFLASLTIGAVALVGDASEDWQLDLLREVTIQVIPAEGVDVATATTQAVEAARNTEGVTNVRVLSDAENTALLEPWLGAGLDIGDLPIPKLIVVEIDDPAAIDLDAFAARLGAIEGVSLDDHRRWTARLQSMANMVVLIGFAVLALVLTATVLSVIFAARGAMAGNQPLVSVLHFIGADDWFVAREFQRHFLLLGLKGGLGGALVAAILFGLVGLMMRAVGTPEGSEVSALFGSFSVGPNGYFGALGVAIAIAILTAVTSRLTVFRYLREVR